MRRNDFGRWARTCSMTALCAFVGWGASVAADDYPSRPLRLVLGFTAGGPTDIPARFLADRLSASLGKPVMVENKPGAGALLAAMDVLSRPRDGHDLLLCTYFNAVNTLLYRNAKYKLSYIVEISFIAKYSHAVAVSHSVPAQSFNELIEYTKAHPERINYGHLGAGSTQNLLAKKLEKATGMKMTPIPYKGTPGSTPGDRRRANAPHDRPAAGGDADVRDQAGEDSRGHRHRALGVDARGPHAEGERDSILGVCLARRLRRIRHTAAGRRSPQQPDRAGRQLVGLSRAGREIGLGQGVID